MTSSAYLWKFLYSSHQIIYTSSIKAFSSTTCYCFATTGRKARGYRSRRGIRALTIGKSLEKSLQTSVTVDPNSFSTIPEVEVCIDCNENAGRGKVALEERIQMEVVLKNHPSPKFSSFDNSLQPYCASPRLKHASMTSALYLSGLLTYFRLLVSRNRPSVYKHLFVRTTRYFSDVDVSMQFYSSPM